MNIQIDNIIDAVRTTIESHKLDGEGRYARWLWQNDENDRKLGLNEYGCADAANILYSIGDFPSSPDSRAAWIETLQNFQNPKSGIFEEATHHFIHTTAHCIAALELFDAKPKYPLTGLKKYADKAGLYDLLENLQWKIDPWSQSHQGAGIYASLVLSDSVDSEWVDAYFDWLWENADPETGMWRKGTIKEGTAPLFNHMGSTFHYLFNHEHAHKPLRYPEKLIDTCIYLYENKLIGDDGVRPYKGDKFGQYIGFLEVDWVYCITRACRQTPYRFDDCQRVLKDFTVNFIDFLNGIDIKTHDGFNDLHMLFGSVCALAELQQALPGMLCTKKPLKLVLDRRPFI